MVRPATPPYRNSIRNSRPAQGLRPINLTEELPPMNRELISKETRQDVREHLATWLLPRIVGAQRAAALMLTGATLDARAAERWGLAAEVTPDGEALPRALELARSIAGMPHAAVTATKRALAFALEHEFEPSLALELEQTEPLLDNELFRHFET